MSQWTHVLGMIRFEDMDRSVWPKPRIDRSQQKADVIHDIFLRNIPSGSEGDLDVQTIITHSGPTVVFSGDLRDFGESDIPEICKWLNDSYSSVKGNRSLFGTVLPCPMTVRDVVINCDVEYHKNKLMIVYNSDSGNFIVDELLSSNQSDASPIEANDEK